MSAILKDDLHSVEIDYDEVIEHGVVNKTKKFQSIPKKKPPISKRNSENGNRVLKQKSIQKKEAEPQKKVEKVRSKIELSINSTQQAVKHLRALQNYAISKDNFPALDVLMRVEHVFQYPPTEKDFECD